MIVAQDATAPGSGGAGRLGRWLFCLALVLGLHVAAVLMLLHNVQAPDPTASSPDTVMIDLAPASVTPVATASAPPPAPATPPPPAPEPPPAPPLEPAPFLSVPTLLPAVPALQEAAPLPPPPVPLPVVRAVRPPRPVRHAAVPPPAHPPAEALSRAAPQPENEMPAAPSSSPVAAAPQAAPRNPAAVPNWQRELLGRLQRVKRYPEAAQDRSEQGVASIRFTIDRTGHVLSASLVRSSGSDTLDEEAMAMIHRADPLPPPPAEVGGSTVTLTVPVSFALQ